MKKLNIKTQEEARDFAINWQCWQCKQALSYKEVAEWTEYFRILGNKINLIEEFKENCII